MANIASQVKRNRQNETRRGRNKAVRTNLKSYLRAFHVAADTGDRDQAESAFQAASRKLDKAAQKGIVHRNYAANKKSRMARTLAQL